jgi:hypothetical protein
MRNLVSVCELVMMRPRSTHRVTKPERYLEQGPAYTEAAALARESHCRSLDILIPLPDLVRNFATDIIATHCDGSTRIRALVLQSAQVEAAETLLQCHNCLDILVVPADAGNFAAAAKPYLACDEIALMHRPGMDPESSLVYPGPELKAIGDAFELVWFSAHSGTAGQSDIDRPPPHLAGLLEHFASGGTDHAVQRALNISGRTLSRRAAELLKVLNARNRFQAGAEAARRNWI